MRCRSPAAAADVVWPMQHQQRALDDDDDVTELFETVAERSRRCQGRSDRRPVGAR